MQGIIRGTWDMMVLVAMLVLCLIIEATARSWHALKRDQTGTSELRNWRALSDQLKPLP